MESNNTERNFLDHQFAKKRQLFLTEREYQAFNFMISKSEGMHRNHLRLNGISSKYFDNALKKFKNAGYI